MGFHPWLCSCHRYAVPILISRLPWVTRTMCASPTAVLLSPLRGFRGLHPRLYSEAARGAAVSLRARGTSAADRAAHEIENLLADADLLEHCRLSLLET